MRSIVNRGSLGARCASAASSAVTSSSRPRRSSSAATRRPISTSRGCRDCAWRAASSAPFRSPSSSRTSLSDSHSAGPRSSAGRLELLRELGQCAAPARDVHDAQPDLAPAPHVARGQAVLRLGQDLGGAVERPRALVERRRAQPQRHQRRAAVGPAPGQALFQHLRRLPRLSRALERVDQGQRGLVAARFERRELAARGDLAVDLLGVAGRRDQQVQQPSPFGRPLLDAERALVDRDRLRAVAGRPERHRPALEDGDPQRDAGGSGGLALRGLLGGAGGAFEGGHRLGSAPGGQQELGVSEQRRGVVRRALGARGELAEEPFQRGFGRGAREAGRQLPFGRVGLQFARDLIDQRLAALALDRPVGPRGRHQHRHHKERRPAQGRDAHMLRIAEKNDPRARTIARPEGRPR